jgi:hypothetical protein
LTRERVRSGLGFVAEKQIGFPPSHLEKKKGKQRLADWQNERLSNPTRVGSLFRTRGARVYSQRVRVVKNISRVALVRSTGAPGTARHARRDVFTRRIARNVAAEPIHAPLGLVVSPVGAILVIPRPDIGRVMTGLGLR